MVVRLFALSIILVGFIILLFPHIEQNYYSYQERQLVDEFQQLETIFNEYSETNDQESSGTVEMGSGLIGLLSIEKIDLTLPILIGADAENLKIGAGYLTNTTPIGDLGNTAIAAHRSYTFGRQFNRLDEVEEGDVVQIKTNGEELVYKVFQISIVVPEDVSVLEPMGDESIITLITCEPMKNPTHRLIVHAKKIS